MKKYIETGQIVSTHGTDGRLKVLPWCDGAEFLTQFEEFYLSPAGGKTLQVQSAKVHGRTVLIKASGIDTMEQAQALKDQIIYIDRDDIDLPDGEYFIQDLIGGKVFDVSSDELLGELTGIDKLPANDVWQISSNGKTYLLPAIPSVVIDIDIDNGKILINPLKGIFDNED